MGEIGADKLAKIIDTLAFNSREVIMGLSNSTLVSSDLPYIDVPRNILEVDSSTGIIVDGSLPGVINIRIEKWMIHELDTFFIEWEKSGYSVSKFDELIFNDNIYEISAGQYGVVDYSGITTDSVLNKIYNPDTNEQPVSNGATRVARERYKSIYQPLTKSLVRLGQILFGTALNLASYIIESDNRITNADSGAFSLLNGTNKTDFVGTVKSYGEDPRILFGDYSDMFTDAVVGYWLAMIRNSQNPKYVSNSRLIPFDIKSPVFNSDLSITNSRGQENYMFSSPWQKFDTFGHYGDMKQHQLAGKSWDICSEKVSLGIGGISSGSNSFTSGFYTTAAGNASSAFNTRTWAIDDCTSTFGVGIYGTSEIPDDFTEITAAESCSAACEIIPSESALKILGTKTQYSTGSAVIIYDAYDEDDRLIPNAIKATVSRVLHGTSAGITYTTLYVIYDDVLERSLRSLSTGKISTVLSEESEIGSRLFIGQYNALVDSYKDVFQIGTGSSDDDRRTFCRVQGGSSPVLDIGADTDKLLSVSSTAITSYINGIESFSMTTSDGIVMHAGDDISLSMDDGSFELYLNNKSGKLEISSEYFQLSHGNDTYINVSGSFTRFVTTSFIDIKTTGDDKNINISGIVSLFKSDGHIYIGNSHYTVPMAISAGNEVKQSFGTIIHATDTCAISTTSGHWSGNGSKSIDVDKLTVSSALKIRDENYNNFTTFSHNPVTGRNFAFTLRESSPTQIINNVTLYDNGSHEIEKTGLYTFNASETSAVSNSEFMEGTIHNVVPDTTTGNKWNHYIVSAFDTNHRWVLGRDFYNGKRVWSNKQTDGNTWTGWRSFSYYDEVSGMGKMREMKSCFMDDVANDGSSTKFSVSLNKSDISPWYKQWGSSTVYDGIGYVGIYGSVLDVDASMGQLVTGGAVADGGIADIKSFEVSKVGETVFFDLVIRVNPFTDSDKIGVTRGALPGAAPGYGYSLMAYISGDLYPQLTPAYADCDFHETQPGDGAVPATTVYGTQTEPNDYSYSEGVTHKLIITPQLQDISTTQYAQHGVIFQIHRYDQTAFRFYRHGGTLIRFSGHYFATNSMQL